MKKVLMIIGGIVVVIVILVIIVFFFFSMTSNKLVCECDEGTNITIMYNDKTITGYTAKGISYDLDGQKEYAESIGMDAYLDEFSTYYSSNTSGSCTRDE